MNSVTRQSGLNEPELQIVKSSTPGVLKHNHRPRVVAVKEREETFTAQLTAHSQAISGKLDFVNIDQTDINNQLAVVDYVEDIYGFYRRIEMKNCVVPDYMMKQEDVNHQMRSILMDWLIEVHLKFKLMPETLFLTANLMDRYLCCQQVSRKVLQLVGVTAMLIAAKYEEIWAPEVQDFVFICDGAYTRGQISSMEKAILNKVQFNLTVPTPYVFMVRFLKAAAADQQMEMVAWYMIELCLQEYAMLQFPPSLLSSASIYSAFYALQRSPQWTTSLQHHSGYSESELKECACMILGFHAKASENSLKVVHKKYSSSKFLSVAKLSPATFPPPFALEDFFSQTAEV